MQCDQLVTIDNCCNPTQCSEQASWRHAESGFSLCALHYSNAVKYAFENRWDVAGKQVSFPQGWAGIERTTEPTSTLTPTEEVRPSGLVIESGSLSPSGLVIERG